MRAGGRIGKMAGEDVRWKGFSVSSVEKRGLGWFENGMVSTWFDTTQREGGIPKGQQFLP